jgi:autotransporter passenger strand-loop-strand repeat protein
MDPAAVSSDYIVVSSGVTSSGVYVTHSLTVENGGVAIATVVHGSAVIDAGGLVSATEVQFGGRVNLHGSAIDTTLLKGARMNVSHGGVAVSTIVASGALEWVIDGGSQSGGRVDSGGSMSVETEGLVTKVSGAAGSLLHVDSGGTLLSGNTAGDILVMAGGVALANVLRAGGVADVLASGVASGTVVSLGGLEVIGSGGVASRARVTSGGVESASVSGESFAASVYAGGVESAASHATVSGLLVADGGRFVWEKSDRVAALKLHDGAEIDIDITSAQAVISGDTLEIMSKGGTKVIASSTLYGAAGLAVTAIPVSAGLTEILVTTAATQPSRLAAAMASFVPHGGSTIEPAGAAPASSSAFPIAPPK